VPHVYYLPFAESLDYCRVGYIVPLAPGRRVPLMAELLDALGAVSASEWAQRRRAAELAGDAFVSRETGPTAAHHLIAQMCRMAAQARGGGGRGRRAATPQMCPPPGLEELYRQRQAGLHEGWYRPLLLQPDPTRLANVTVSNPVAPTHSAPLSGHVGKIVPGRAAASTTEEGARASEVSERQRLGSAYAAPLRHPPRPECSDANVTRSDAWRRRYRCPTPGLSTQSNGLTRPSSLRRPLARPRPPYTTWRGGRVL